METRNKEVANGIELLDQIYRSFPEVAKDLDLTLSQSWDLRPDERNEMWTGLVERFSQITTDAISRKDAATARKYLEFIERKLEEGDEFRSKVIDTYYVECLMWNIEDNKLKQWGWKLIPVSLKSLYLKFWGKQSWI